MRITPIKSYQSVMVGGTKKVVVQTWGDYIKSKIRNYATLKIKYGIRFSVNGRKR